jgi:hypothetical protein
MEPDRVDSAKILRGPVAVSEFCEILEAGLIIHTQTWSSSALLWVWKVMDMD